MNPPTFTTVRRRDVLVLLAVLLGGGLFYGFAQSDITMKRAMLQESAARHESDWFRDLKRADFDFIVKVDSGKSNGLFGRDWGVVRLLSRKKGDTPMDTFTGVEYFYEHDGQAWQQADTARIDLPEHIYEGYRTFEEAGYDVDSEAYLRYNR